MIRPQPEPVRVASTDGVTVVAHDWGGGGEPVILCHATGFHGRYWDPICRRLGDDYRSIAIDLRGHGDSEVPDGLDMDWSGMAADILAVLDHFGVHGVRGIGHSMGGCSIVRAELARPGSFTKGWLCEPIIIPDDPTMFSPGHSGLAESARRRREVFDSLDAAFDRYASRPPFSDVHPEALRAYVDGGFRPLPDGTVILKCRGATEAAVFDHSNTDTFANLGAVNAAFTIAGSGDGAGPAELAHHIAEQLPHGTFEHWGDLTHFAPMEDPDRITEAIRRALA